MENEAAVTFPERSKRKVHELVSLALPIFCMLFAPCIVGFLERICLSRYSLEALEGSIQALYFLQIFQFPLLNFANMTQVFIGKHLGSGEPHEVGRCVWQMGWIALLSMLFILPIGLFTSSYVFKGNIGEASATLYFNILLGINFLYPLGAALSSFYLVQGKINFIIRNTLLASALHLILDLALIFGIPPLIPPLGILGASISMVISRLVFCGILFFNFLKLPFIEKFQTNRWKIDFSKIRHYFRVCSPRAAGRVVAMVIWALTSRFMVTKGGDYLLVLSIGGTLILLCYFFTESLIQALTVIYSRALGAKKHQEIGKNLWAGFVAFLFVNGALSIPFLIFPDFVLSFFFTEPPSEILLEYLRWSLRWIWGWLFFSGLAGLFLPFLLAMQDTFYYMTVMSLTLLTSTLPVYSLITRLNGTPDKFWLILMLEQIFVLSCYAMRVYWLRRKQFRIENGIAA